MPSPVGRGHTIHLQLPSPPNEPSKISSPESGHVESNEQLQFKSMRAHDSQVRMRLRPVKATYPDRDKIELLKEAAESGDDNASFKLACMTWDSRDSSQKSLNDAVNSFREAALKGIIDAKPRFAHAIRYRISEGKLQANDPDAVEARKFNLEAAEASHAGAQHLMGFFCEHGIGLTDKDPDEALKWYFKAARNGVREAQDRFDSIVQLARKDQDSSANSFNDPVNSAREAALNGKIDSQYNFEFANAIYARIFKHELQANDPAAIKASKLNLESAEAGYPDAQYLMGVFYERGIGHTELDLDEALKWYRKAAENGLPEAQSRIGVFYERGIGHTEPDADEALRWYFKAAKSGVSEAQRYFDRIVQEHTPWVTSNRDYFPHASEYPSPP